MLFACSELPLMQLILEFTSSLQLERFSDPEVINKYIVDSCLQSKTQTSVIVPQDLRITHVRAIRTSFRSNTSR